MKRNLARECARLEETIYPPIMVSLGQDYFNYLLKHPRHKLFGFGCNGEVVGYCAVEVNKKFAEIADFAMLPEHRSATMAFLSQVLKEITKKVIIFDARESTSYRLLVSPTGQKWLSRHGWKVSMNGDFEYWGSEKMFSVRLTRSN